MKEHFAGTVRAARYFGPYTVDMLEGAARSLARGEENRNAVKQQAYEDIRGVLSNIIGGGGERVDRICEALNRIMPSVIEKPLPQGSLF